MSWTFDQTGGHAVLDFANTVSERTSPSPIERLTSYDDVVEFARQLSLLSDADAASLHTRAREDSAEAARIHRRAIELRDAIHSVFTAIVREERPPPDALAVLNRHLGQLQLTDDLAVTYCCSESGLDTPLAPIVRATLDLITGERERVRICASSSCGFLFLDTSKNRSRRWCDMKQCGNREKARRHHARARSRPHDAS
jgi:predicted RNA-binding Zn ribbon-like protein